MKIVTETVINGAFVNGNVATKTYQTSQMSAISLSDKGQKDLETIMETFDLEPSKRKVVERGLELYKEKRLNGQNDEQTTTETN